MRVLLVRADGTPDDDGRELTARGFEVTAEPFIQVAACADPSAGARAAELLAAVARPDAWLVLTSAAGIRALATLLGTSALEQGLLLAERRGARFAAVGPTSARAVRALGVGDVIVPDRSHTATALLEALRPHGPATAVLPRSSIGDQLLPLTLEARGWDVVSRVVYETAPVADVPPSASSLAAGAFDALVLRSPSAARAVARLAGPIPTSTRIVAGGPTTAMAARRGGMHVAQVARDSRPTSIADAVSVALAVDDADDLRVRA